jgi:hypothetical protein
MTRVKLSELGKTFLCQKNCLNWRKFDRNWGRARAHYDESKAWLHTFLLLLFLFIPVWELRFGREREISLLLPAQYIEMEGRKERRWNKAFLLLFGSNCGIWWQWFNNKLLLILLLLLKKSVEGRIGWVHCSGLYSDKPHYLSFYSFESLFPTPNSISIYIMLLLLSLVNYIIAFYTRNNKPLQTGVTKGWNNLGTFCKRLKNVL